MPRKKSKDLSTQRKESTAATIIVAVLVVILIIATVYGTYLWKSKRQAQGEKVSPLADLIEEVQIPTASASNFAQYEDTPVSVEPKVAKYAVAADFSNITNPDEFYLSDKAKQMLVKNGFVVVPNQWGEFHSLYENNRYDYAPSFVSSDAILHNYHLIFDHLLRRLEETKFIPIIKELNKSMLERALANYESLKGTQWENAALRNAGFFAVGSKLLDENAEIPSIVKDVARQELDLIEKHEGIEASPLMNLERETGAVVPTPQGDQPLDANKEDYSQYIPRGHYDRTEELKKYFKSMMWYGRLTFRLKNDDELKSAVLITLSLADEKNKDNWDLIYEPTVFFVGISDDITFYQFSDLIRQAYGENVSLGKISSDASAFSEFKKLADKLEPPKINSMPIFTPKLQADRDKEIKGFRFMGQRFTIDASIFQRLVYREVGDKESGCGSDPAAWALCPDSRCLPKGLDVPAAMGSDAAYKLLENYGETEYACYPENMAKMKKYVSQLGKDIWTQNLYWGWLYSLIPLTEEKGTGYPSFMTNDAWVKKDLNAYLGSWAELKHDTILYAKQVYAELGAGEGPQAKDDRGYVEPNVEVYARLASLLKMTRQGLEIRGLLQDPEKELLNILEELVLSLKTISEKELNNTALTDEEYELIRSIGGQLEHIWYEANRQDIESSEMSWRDYLDENPAAIIADVATDPNGSALEEGVGYIYEIYAAVPIEGKITITKGGVFSYYEFKWPMSDRLTDEKWRDILNSGQAPSTPDWTGEFTAREND